jgi:hypothetical protein
MPLGVTVDAFQRGCLQVSWRDGETETLSWLYGPIMVYHVVLHEEKCTDVMSQLLHGKPG